ncbi:MAG: sulfotransferase domain-containing protein [Candidatus Sericytochromatia bacterium]
MHFQIVSPPLPTGATWLINCLLELGVRTTAYGSSWTETPDGSCPGPVSKLEVLLWHLPALHRSHGFSFEPDLEVFWDHQLAYTQYPSRKTILFVRDIRDATYSMLWRQLPREDLMQAKMLLQLPQPFVWDQQIPELFDLPIADTMAYYCLLWLEHLPAEELLLMHFEDSKADPRGQLKRALAFIGVERSESAISEALERSQLEHFKEIVEVMAQKTGQVKHLHRKGETQEWKRVFPPEALSGFAGPVQKTLLALGYEPLPEPGQAQQLDPVQAELRRQAADFLERDELNRLWHWIQEQLPLASDPGVMLLASQMLALLWTLAILGPAQLQLPAAGRMARLFAALNAEFLGYPQIRRAVINALDPDHPLHRLSLPPVFRADPGRSLAHAAAEAQVARQPFLLWQQPGIRLEASGLWQLQQVLDGRDPELAAAVPMIERLPAAADFARLAGLRQAKEGAECRPLRLTELPACILFRCHRLAGLPLGAEPAVWLGELRIHQALGVLAASP